MKAIRPCSGTVVAVCLLSLAAGCSGEKSADQGNTSPQSSPPMLLQGSVHGGQAPIVGAAVTVYVASQQAIYPAVQVSGATTDAQGNFSFYVTCPSPTAQMYVTAAGGNPGAGANSAIHLMALLGQCQNAPSLAVINELTTVAAAYAANQFIGPNGGCVDCTVGPPAVLDDIRGNAPGLPNAMGNAALLANPVTGLDAPSLPSLADCGAAGIVPANCATVRQFNSLGNALAACVNSSGPASAQCKELFNCSVPRATYTSNACTLPAGATAPTDTLQAILSIARNPAAVAFAGIYQTAAQDVVFSPTLIKAPTDLTLSLKFTAGGANGDSAIAIDSSGNAWMTDTSHNRVTVLAPNGVPLFGSPVAGNVLSFPQGIAIDLSGNVWVANTVNNSVTELNAVGTPISSFTGGGLNGPYGLAIDPSGNVWLANSANSVTELNSSGKALSGASGYTGGGSVFNAPFAIAMDLAGNAWVANGGLSGTAANSVTELNLDGVPQSGFPVSGNGINGVQGIAIDAHGNAWVTNSKNGSKDAVVELSPTGAVLSGGSGFTGGGLIAPNAIAFDGAGNVWVANNVGTLTEFSSSGAALSPPNGFLGTGEGSGTGIAIDPSGNVWITNSDYQANHPPSGVTVFLGAAAPTRTPLVAALTMGFTP